MGFLSDILGQSDDQTPDPSTGLTNNDRAQVGWHGLTNLGAILMAGGQPMWGADRAKYLAALGQVPQGMNEEKTGIITQRRQNQQLISEKLKTDNQKLVEQMGQDPKLIEGMPDEMKQIYQLAAKTGNLPAMIEIQKSLEPKVSYGGVYNPRTKQYVNQYGMSVDMSGKHPSGADSSGGTAAAPQRPATVDPTTGIDSATGLNHNELDAAVTQGPGAGIPNYRSILTQTALGLAPMPTNPRSPLYLALQGDAPRVMPGFKTDDYKDRAAMRQSIDSGQLGQKFIYPVQRAINHGVTAINAAENMGLVDNTGITPDNPDGTVLGGLDALQQNLRTKADQAIKQTGKPAAFELAKNNFFTEFSKSMRGTGGTTDQAEREGKIKTIGEMLAGVSTPREMHSVVQKAAEFMTGQAAPIADKWRTLNHMPNKTTEDLLGSDQRDNSPNAAPNVKQNLEYIRTWQPKGLRVGPSAAAAAPANQQTPIEATPTAPANASHPGAYKVPQAAIDEARRRGRVIQ